MAKLNVISELDKLVVHYFNKVNPFEIDDQPVPTSFARGTPDTLANSQIWSNVSDITYPVLVINRTNTFQLQRDRNVPHTEATNININRIAKNKYINTDEPNINIEIYSYHAPVYFTTKYQIIMFCEYVQHSNDFMMQFFERLNQQYMPINSEKYKTIYFDTIWNLKDDVEISDNFNSTSNTKREIKITFTIDGQGYYISQASEKVDRSISKTVLQSFLK